MLLRFAKIAGGLRLLITEVAPLALISASTLTARSVAYIVGFAFGSIGATLWPIVVTLVAISGIFGTTSTYQCEQYYAEIKRIDDLNRALMAPYQAAYTLWSEIVAKSYMQAKFAWESKEKEAAGKACFAAYPDDEEYENLLRAYCLLNASMITYPQPYPNPPPMPTLYTYQGVSTPPDCPPNKKVWLQAVWGSPSEFASQPKGCFLIAYSYSIVDGLKIEYNPFKLNEPF